MFKLFASIFQKEESYPAFITDTLLKAAIERAVDGTDPRMRILPGYAGTLRKPVRHAIEHVVTTVGRLPPPATATHEGRDASPALGAIYTSASRMRDIIGSDSSLRGYLAATKSAPPAVIAMLAVQRNEKKGFGYALVDDKVMSDVLQVSVSFDRHRLLDLTSTEDETRRLMMRRAFDYLLSLALAQVSEQKDEREKLTQQRSLLRVKLDILQKGGGSFSRDMGVQDRGVLQARLGEVEAELEALGPVHEVLQHNLEIVASVLAEAEKYLWLEEKLLRMDAHYVLHGDSDSSVAAVPLHDVCDSNGRRITVLLVSVDPTGLPTLPSLATSLSP